MPARWWRTVRNVVLGLIVFLVFGNGMIMASMSWFRATTPVDAPEWVRIDNFRVVDERVYRGAAPGDEGLDDLAALGVTTIVDLRAEADDEKEDAEAARHGLERVRLPVRDGQLPSEDEVRAFLRIVEEADGPVFLHCGAGVGRTGAMAATYLNATGQTDGTEALERNLAVGPPSLEQIVFALGTSDGEYHDPSLGVTVVSRVLDGPRRIWHNLT